MQRAIMIYGWKLDSNHIMKRSDIDDICIDDYEIKIKKIKKKLKTKINFLEVNTDYDSNSAGCHPIYIALNYIDLKIAVDGNNTCCGGEGILDSKSLKLIKNINNSKNIMCSMDQKDISIVTKKLKIDINTPNVYMDYYDLERKYFVL